MLEMARFAVPSEIPGRASPATSSRYLRTQPHTWDSFWTPGSQKMTSWIVRGGGGGKGQVGTRQPLTSRLGRSAAGMGAYSPAPAPTPPPPGTDAELLPPRAVQGGEVGRCRGSCKSLPLTCNPSPTAARPRDPELQSPTSAPVPPPQLRRAGMRWGGGTLDPRRPLTPRGQEGPDWTSGLGSGPASPRPGVHRRPVHAARPPAPARPRRTRTHSLRCRPPPPQLCLARLGLRISARPADFSASMASRAAVTAAAKTPSGKTLRRGQAARGHRAPPLPALAPRRRPTGRGGGRAGSAQASPAPLRCAPRLPVLPEAVQTKGAESPT